MTAWLIAQAWPYLIGLMALVGVYWRGRHNGKVAAHRDTLESYARTRRATDAADTGVGATDADRIARLRQFAEKS